jgi:REP element-mobilizing transposase RayT
MWYHALNRGNRREAVFHKPGDYDAFVETMIDARVRVPLDLLGYCLMPNHFHLVLRPQNDGDLGRWMQWLLTAHARRYHSHYGTTGHVWQGRFKAFPVQEDDHLRHGAPLRRAQCIAGGVGGAGRGLEVVELAQLAQRRLAPLAGRTIDSRRAVAGTRQ